MLVETLSHELNGIGATYELERGKTMPSLNHSVVEILSTTQNVEDLTSKAETYFLKGVQSYWLVIPTLENIYVFEDAYNYQIFTKKQILQDKNLDISIDLKDIFEVA
jgi:Uma2 family endonuclease